MVAGLPVVATRVGGVPEVVEDGVTGILVPPGDAGQLADAIDRLLGDDKLRRRMGSSGRDRMLRDFNAGKMVDTLRGLYREVLSGATQK